MFRKTPDPNVEFLADKILPELVGGTIVGIATDQPDGEEFGTAGIGLVVRLAGGEHKVVWIDRDEEGNGPGWASVEELGDIALQLREPTI
ncbi:hypothetical protein [Devosia sp.]|uniref:hypothetical protein n=1 Tax=Devosia sp. TaxID=1871048 RepID=UPI001B1EFCB6|nr:hypothetical protein [Devosia sp.]MBO9589509.1 hypothetical protein [Devosia sp.]